MAHGGSDEVQPTFGARRVAGRAGVHDEASAADTRGRAGGREPRDRPKGQDTATERSTRTG